MEKKKILFVSQEITPYLPENEISRAALELPKKMNEMGHEVRIFMPRFGVINERRHQLHEVIRLSGMNIVVNDMDQPLIIKVASVPSARMQVYFIDNDEYFKRKSIVTDKEHNLHPDNDERMLFFCKGVMETVKKLGWKPDIIHLHGWMTSVFPIYLKKFQADDALFNEAKVVFSAHSKGFEGKLGENLVKAMRFDGVEESDLEFFDNPTFENLQKGAAKFSDGMVKANEDVHEDVINFVNSLQIPVFDGTNLLEEPKSIDGFYHTVAVEESIA